MTRTSSWAARAVAGAWVVIASSGAQAPAQERTAVPPALESWREWVLQGEEARRCPFLATAPAARDARAHRCAWPERLELRLDAVGGTFTQRWQLYAHDWVALPGSLEHWPREVRIDGAPGAIVARGGVPSARLPPGTHVVSGRFAWSSRPEQLAVAPQTSLVELTVDGQRIVQPERPDGALWLGKRRSAEEPQQIAVQVYRLVEDQVPVRLTTLLRLRVSGEGREEMLSRALPAGFVPLRLSSEVSVRLEADGRLRVQVRPGSWEIVLVARGAGVAGSLQRPPVQGLWAREEVWSFASDDRLRIAAAEGAEPIDPAQANVPQDWRGFPAFRMAPDATLRIVERSRGLANVDDNQLRLRRELWLDFDHGGFTAVDEIQGTLRRDWRLEMAAPWQLESARSGEDTLLVTEVAAPGQRGVELRAPQLALAAVARTERARGALPATGWQTRFEDVDGQLHLPPGHRLLGVWGADGAPGSWWSSWGLWNLFGVLIVVVFTAWVAGRTVAGIALAALLLTYQDSPGHIWLWGNLLAAVAIARAAPGGRLRRAAGAYRTASFLVLGIALLPFLWGQVRLALYPQLEATEPRPVLMDADVVEELRVPASAAPSAPAAAAARKERPAGPSEAERLQRYAPGTLLQAGPGIPDWRFKSYRFGWSGPVEPEQQVTFLYIGPAVLALWRITGVVLLATLFLWLLRQSLEWRVRLPGGWGGSRGAAASGLLLALALAPLAARAQDTPDAALLEQLKTRLTAPPACVPTCAEILSAEVDATPERLTVTLQASALASVAIAIPHAGDRWQLEEVSVDGRSSLAVGRERDGALWVPLSSGAHTLRLGGRIAAAESLQLVFPQPPRSIAARAQGWDIAGLGNGRLLAGSLELTRRRAAGEASGAPESGTEFPPFVRVTREFLLAHDWTLTTTLERLAPERAAINVAVPLVAQESVLTAGIEVRAGRALVGLAQGQDTLRWVSSLPRAPALTLAMPADAARTEVWRFSINRQWHAEFEGLPATLPASIDADAWIWEFHPRPGERLSARIVRPEPAAGRTLAIDSATHRTTAGKRSTTAHLELRYRSTQGERHAIGLPADARVTAVSLDGTPLQLRPEKGELSLSLPPGSHSVAIEWTSARGAALVTRAAAVDLRAPASNLLTTVQLPLDRWPLAASGPGVGPAFLYWGELLVFLVTAWLLGRSERSPLRTHEWLLLGLGLSTLSWAVLLVVALWLFAMRWRERWAGDTSAWRFDLVQVLLALFTVIAVGVLIFFGIRYGLLASPDMGVIGPSSSRYTFGWFLDQSEGALPEPRVFAVPLWIYKALMFAWALWIAIALARWLAWAWRAWTSGGYWRPVRERPVEARP